MSTPLKLTLLFSSGLTTWKGAATIAPFSFVTSSIGLSSRSTSAAFSLLLLLLSEHPTQVKEVIAIQVSAAMAISLFLIFFMFKIPFI